MARGSASASGGPATDGRPGMLGLVLVVVGLVGVLVGGGVVAEAASVRWAWVRSGAEERMERRLRAEAPSWVEDDPRPSALTGRGGAPAVADPARGPSPEGAPRARAEQLTVEAVEFRFLDPPEPGAHARLVVALRNRSGAESGPVALGIAAAWFDRYGIIGAIPAVSADRTEDDGHRYFDFPGPAPGEVAAFELHLLATDEDTEAPEVRLTLLDGRPIGRVRPRTTAPRPRPGPVHAVAVPRLGIRSGVVPMDWEPPPFVVGQLRDTAAVGEGNTVLVGHLEGQAGDVFGRLPRARLGDEVTATSRGLEYHFTISDTHLLPSGDGTFLQPTDRPRLTLMTCAGAWNPLTGDYSHRLWIIAEPPELARDTLAARAERLAREAQAATSVAAAARARAGAALARAALARLRPGHAAAAGAPEVPTASPGGGMAPP